MSAAAALATPRPITAPATSAVEGSGAAGAFYRPGLAYARLFHSPRPPPHLRPLTLLLPRQAGGDMRTSTGAKHAIQSLQAKTLPRRRAASSPSTTRVTHCTLPQLSPLPVASSFLFRAS